MGFPIQTRPKATRRANPATYVTAEAPPIWITHGTADLLVPFNQSQILFGAYHDAGAPATFSLVQDAGHTDAYLTGSAPTPQVVVHTTEGGNLTRTDQPAPTFETVRAFLDQNLAR